MDGPHGFNSQTVFDVSHRPSVHSGLFAAALRLLLPRSALLSIRDEHFEKSSKVPRGGAALKICKNRGRRNVFTTLPAQPSPSPISQGQTGNRKPQMGVLAEKA